MIVTVERNGLECLIALPSSDAEIFNQQRKIGILDPKDTVMLVKNIDSDICELSCIEGELIDIDHLNLLARYIDGMTYEEMTEFSAALCYTGYKDIKDIINLTQNLSNYTLIPNNKTLEYAGKRHYMNVHGCLCAEDEESIDFAELSKEIIRLADSVSTPYGVVCKNGLEEVSVFDGQTMPTYFDRRCVVACEIIYGEKSEMLFLPCDNISLEKAVARLGASDISDVGIRIDESYIECKAFNDMLRKVDTATLEELNRLAEATFDLDIDDFDKLNAVAEYADDRVQSISEYILLAEHIDDFIYIPNVDDEYELGEYLIRESGEYLYDASLDDYYGYMTFGKDMKRIQNGEFINRSYVGLNENLSLDEILGQDRICMQMGGM